MHLSNTCVAFAADAGVESAVALVKRLLGEDGATRVLVFCGAQSEEHAEPLEQLLALKDRHLDRLSLSFVMDREANEAELLRGRLDAAKIDALAAKLFDAKSVREYHVYGSPELGNDVTTVLTKLGVDATRIHRARLKETRLKEKGKDHAPAAHPSATTGATPKTAAIPAGAPTAPQASAEQAHAASAANPSATTSTAPKTVAIPDNASQTRVEFVMDGRRRAFSMHTGTESILDAAARANIDLPFSCKAGVCSTCRTKLVRGQVEMRENYALEDWELEQGFILACQSHAKTPEIELNYDEK
jgi:ring-1,2-phenylacetyl-CoA epoxidase subunit PaaE